MHALECISSAFRVHFECKPECMHPTFHFHQKSQFEHQNFRKHYYLFTKCIFFHFYKLFFREMVILKGNNNVLWTFARSGNDFSITLNCKNSFCKEIVMFYERFSIFWKNSSKNLIACTRFQNECIFECKTSACNLEKCMIFDLTFSNISNFVFIVGTCPFKK